MKGAAKAPPNHGDTAETKKTFALSGTADRRHGRYDERPSLHMAPTPDFPDRVPQLVGDLVLLRELREDDVPVWVERPSDLESAFNTIRLPEECLRS